MAYTFEELAEHEMGTVYYTCREQRGEHTVDGLIMRGAASLTAYVGISLDHPIAGWDQDYVPLDVHGGLSWSKEGDGKLRPEGFWWYGWDYGHYTDRSFIDLQFKFEHSYEATEWTVEMVEPEVRGAIEQMFDLMDRKWYPTPEEQQAMKEEVVRREQFMKDVASGKAARNLQAATKKWERERKLDG